MNEEIFENARRVIACAQQYKPTCCMGPTGPTGPSGGPTGPTHPVKSVKYPNF